ncbi:MAG: ComF family protein [Alphaproteobacteria bacterium]|nr:ComF family protein [Alphaproteobacteria bacterium]
MRFIGPPLCDACGAPFDYPVPERTLCLSCEAEPPAFRRARAVFVYDEACRDLVLGFKHADRTDLAPLLARLMAHAAADLLSEADGLVPVPLHRRRLAQRRFNQSALLAEALGRLARVPNLTGLVVRLKPTPPQSGGPGKRARNVAGAFRLSEAAPFWRRRRAKEQDGRVHGKHLVIVDDVLTTGATVSAVAKLLLRHGAARVDVVTVARVDRG